MCGMRIDSSGLPTLLLLVALLPGCATHPAPQSNALAAVAARIDGEEIDGATLDAHAARTGLAREAGLEDLIDLRLTRRAAAAAQLPIPSEPWSEEARTQLEHTLARKLALDVPPAVEEILLDHAWVKDAPNERDQAAQRMLLEKLRAKVAAGETLPTAWNALGADGTAWHIGDHESYPYEVIPAAARDLPAGALSPIIPGDGGLHLFKIHAHQQKLPPADLVRATLQPHLREGVKIERSAEGAR